MAYSNFVNGFKVTTRSAIDQRILLTKADMLQVSQNKKYLVPDLYFALCLDDRKFYLYDANSSADPFTGKFHPVEEVVDFYSTEKTKENFNNAVDQSDAIVSINEVLDGTSSDPGLVQRVHDVENKIDNIVIDGGMLGNG